MSYRGKRFQLQNVGFKCDLCDTNKCHVSMKLMISRIDRRNPQEAARKPKTAKPSVSLHEEISNFGNMQHCPQNVRREFPKETWV